mmetsp:Transcript_76222/g.204765  ORF Transcript_76222/g.204765 Transcript_76222/m.204765 type:complete len:102 (-) Transcript_76222:93-398(-)
MCSGGTPMKVGLSGGEVGSGAARGSLQSAGVFSGLPRALGWRRRRGVLAAGVAANTAGVERFGWAVGAGSRGGLLRCPSGLVATAPPASPPGGDPWARRGR